jgi:hypothetical protein
MAALLLRLAHLAHYCTRACSAAAAVSGRRWPPSQPYTGISQGKMNGLNAKHSLSEQSMTGQSPPAFAKLTSPKAQSQMS